MYKDLMIPMTGSAGEADALRLAVKLAARHSARLSVLESVDLPVPISHAWDMVPDPTGGGVYDALRERGQQRLAELKARLDDETVCWDARAVEALYADAPHTVAREAFDADLCLLAGSGGRADGAAALHAWFTALLLESGRPVLVVPPASGPTLPLRRAMVAWQPTRPTARAVHDALPLLADAGLVELVVIGRGDDDPALDSARRMVAHLVRHSIPTDLVNLRAGEHSVAEVLLDYAERSGVQLLVAGGYGHSRLREWVLGGVTRELLLSAQLPVFFGH
ncbi:universal stress protein [Lysobacter yananisis]|uniref:Universal stress protein n=1 Tax=Lysobacter yananisis TaxID=1003114 RepID=A0ABY9PDG5_9GAMM|nr:universal stress protein [Lysobacter yananisis]WMT03882.1 universal stress protein [Lysobacter yananisis]